ncbi:hypothetical protein BCR42DRAFT_455117 [Absidia repens]|uniref:Homeobox domain-containing protein n=1 Tax=Absidia repens TaxID=90262 RepID=A0A1X2I4G6_9FUNG|nr:hypothetical protein BCR42DRAFT_455117 [Absidia repens]
MSTTDAITANSNIDNATTLTSTNNTTNSDPSNLDAPTTSVRKRTRATAEQLSVLEDTFAANVSPNSKLRKELSERLQMSERSIQIWFQNRRAKVKHMQKRAQMQMQQASIRAQLYHYHQQQYGIQPYGGGAPIMPLPQQQQQQQQQVYPRIPLPRSSSVDSSSLPQQQMSSSTSTMSTPPASTSSSCTSSASPNASLESLIPPTNHLSYPLQDTTDFPDYLHGGPLSPSPSPHHVYSPSACLSYPPHPPSQMDPNTVTPSSSLPSLVAVPDAGPTAMLATPPSSMTPGNLTSTPATTPPLALVDQATVSPQDIWPSSVRPDEHVMRSQSVAAGSSSLQSKHGNSTDLPTPHPIERSLSNPPMTTIDPSNLMMNGNTSTTSTSPTLATTSNVTAHSSDMNLGLQEQQTSLSKPPSTNTDIHLNCTTLTIGTWHRFKLRASDLVCVFKNNVFEWRIEDAGCHFKMEIPLSSVASIDFVEDNNVLADVHFDISESPSFYMETTTTTTTGSHWVQCSDFTEGKQASRFFRHSLKGVSQHLKQDLVMLMDQCPETRRWVRFVEQQQQQQTSQPQYHQPHFPQQHQQQPQPQLTSYYPTPDYIPQSHPHHPHPSVTTHDPMLMTTTADLSMTSPDMAFSSSMYIPPTPSSYWSSMYQMPSPQTPMMMGASSYLV